MHREYADNDRGSIIPYAATPHVSQEYKAIQSHVYAYARHALYIDANTLRHEISQALGEELLPANRSMGWYLNYAVRAYADATSQEHLINCMLDVCTYPKSVDIIREASVVCPDAFVQKLYGNVTLLHYIAAAHHNPKLAGEVYLRIRPYVACPNLVQSRRPYIHPTTSTFHNTMSTRHVESLAPGYWLDWLMSAPHIQDTLRSYSVSSGLLHMDSVLSLSHEPKERRHKQSVTQLHRLYWLLVSPYAHHLPHDIIYTIYEYL